ncbi:MAG: lytic transglycosylase domain-containing protein [Erythrobacter sp.]
MRDFSTRRIAALAVAATLSCAIASPAIAQNNSAAQYFTAKSQQSKVPAVLSDSERAYYSSLFKAINAEDWVEVDGLLTERQQGLLHGVAIAEYYTHANSPAVTADQVSRWFDIGIDLPQAEQLGRLGQRRGLDYIPSLPRTRSFQRQPGASKRIRPRSVDDGTMPEDIESAILAHIRDDDPDGARLLLDGIDANLSSAARAEWRQKVAWSYYIENNDLAALAIARTVAGGTGAWVAEGAWVEGLAAWRLNDCAGAANAFARAASQSTNNELTAAAHFWASRAAIRCRKPADAERHLQSATRFDETLYGMLAIEQRGQDLPKQYATADLSDRDWRALSRIANVRTAVALMEIDRDDLADEVLRHQARIGDPDDFRSLSRLARELGLPRTQIWMAHNAPRGSRAEPAMRYPVARWEPSDGWRVDPALAFAHALQESSFRTSAVSPANARGLMQITPITVRQHAGRLNMNASYVNLNDPAVNLSFGQENLTMLRDSRATQGLLPKIMAAYNAGLTPITRWNSEVRDGGDPLLYMESLPYWETRGYVAIVMRNYWMYERQADAPSPSRTALAEGKWPTFPALNGNSNTAGGVRLTRDR